MRVRQDIRKALRGSLVLLSIVVAGLEGLPVLAEPGPAPGQALLDGPLNNDPEGILNLDIDQLAKVDVVAPAMSLEVTSVDKHEGTVGQSAAAIYVVTQEMIRRSGANSIPDLLRLVPGLQVAQIDSHNWAISSRGFNGGLADKLLVLIDGRSVYTPIFSGVHWDVQDMLLEDVERIEVIRGPGGTLWGANAVNGVINIITKKAKDTQGSLVTYGGGTEDRGLGGARYGGKVGENLHWRVYGKHFERDSGYRKEPSAEDDWRQSRAGFRMDWQADASNSLTLQGDCYEGSNGFFSTQTIPTFPGIQFVTGDELVTGGNLLARWNHVISDESDWQLQAYFDRADRKNMAGMDWDSSVSTFEVDFQHRFPLSPHHEITWGAVCRQVYDVEETNGFQMDYLPARRTTNLFGVFLQDKITLIEDRLFFTVGSKFEENDYTGFEYQPSGRLLYAVDKKHAFWGAVSRAVRTPSRFDADGFSTIAMFYPFYSRGLGSRNYGSEDLMAYEIGYRAQPDPKFAYDIALFYNVYEDVASMMPGDPFVDPDGNFIFPYEFDNGARAQTYGLEISSQYAVTDRWRLSGSYSLLRWDYHTVLAESDSLHSANSRNQVRMISSWDLGSDWQFDMVFRYVDTTYSSIVCVPAYLTMDLRLAWQPTKNLEMAVVGRNLFDRSHREYKEWEYITLGSEVERSVFGKLTWRY